MKENYCKWCIHLSSKIENGSVISQFCKIGKQLLTTVQDPFIPGLTKTKVFVRPVDSKCSSKEKKTEEIK